MFKKLLMTRKRIEYQTAKENNNLQTLQQNY